MNKYEMNPDILPAGNKMTVASVLRRTEMISSDKELELYINRGDVYVRDENRKVRDKNETVRVSDNTVINVWGLGSVRIRLRNPNKVRNKPRIN